MRRRRFPRRFEIADRKEHRYRSQRDPCQDAERVHERQQVHLMLELMEDTTLRA